jgi:putative hydrolase of the HAD superfamily
MPRTIRGILFDLGSTLWHHVDDGRWHALETEANARAGALLRNQVRGRAMTPMDDATLGAAVRQAIDRAITRTHHEAPDDEPNFALIAQQALWSLSIATVDHSLGEAVFEALRIRSLHSHVLFEDTIPTLTTLRERNYILGVATNRAYGGEPFIDDLRQMGLLQFFVPQAIAISADLGLRKPNSAVFQHAVSGLGLSPYEVAMVGNDIVADIWGAQRLGLFAIWKPTSEYRALAQEDLPTFAQQEDHGPLVRSDASLVAWALQQAHAADVRTAGMMPPDTVITHLAELHALFPEIP